MGSAPAVSTKSPYLTTSQVGRVSCRLIGHIVSTEPEGK